MLVGVWQDSRFSGGAREGIAFTRSIDGGTTWSAPVQVNGVPAVQALLPAVAVRPDGTIGVLYYDMRNDTTDPATLHEGPHRIAGLRKPVGREFVRFPQGTLDTSNSFNLVTLFHRIRPSSDLLKRVPTTTRAAR